METCRKKEEGQIIEATRIIGFTVAREITPEEAMNVSGGAPVATPYSQVSVGDQSDQTPEKPRPK